MEVGTPQRHPPRKNARLLTPRFQQIGLSERKNSNASNEPE